MKMLLCCAFIFLFTHAVHAATYALHTVHSGSVPSRVRIVNLSDAYGVVEIVGFDDQGEEYGPVELEIEANASVVLLTRELENGAPDKGLLDGLGNGSGQWQLQLNTDLKLGAVSFKGGVLSDVLSSAELVSGDVAGVFPPRFVWAHQLVDGGVWFTESHTAPYAIRNNSHSRYLHELLSAYDWIPHDEFEGVLFGWGDYQYEDDKDVWMRFSGHLDYSAFAVQYGLVDGELSLHAYSMGIIYLTT